mgnify:CR=1 FL=1
MIPLLDRYVTRELVPPLLFGLAIFSTLLTVATALLKAVTLLSRGAPAWAVWQLFLMKWVILLPLVLPMAMLLAAMLAFGRLSGDSELVALQAAGTPLLRVGRAPLVMGLILSIAGLLLTEHVVPGAAQRAHRLELVIAAALRSGTRDLDPSKGFVYHDVEGRVRRRTILAGGFNVDAGRLDHVVYLEYMPDGNKVRWLVEAEWCEWNEREPYRWLFHHGVIKYIEETTLNRYKPTVAFQRQEFTIRRTPRELRAGMKEPEEMTFYELSDYLEEMRRQGVSARKLRELRVELHRKIADPFMALSFALVGTPLGIRRPRTGSGVGLGLSILILFLFYLLWSSARVLGQGGSLPETVAAWLANVVILLLGLGLTWRATR